MDKSQILSEIKRTAKENGGVPLGRLRFEAETGIKYSDWRGKFWVRWGEAVAEAGFSPNKLQEARPEEEILGALASFVRDLGRFPVSDEIKLKARSSPGFPWHNTFTRFGGKRSLAARLRDFCAARGESDVAAICSEVAGDASALEGAREKPSVPVGYVYLMKYGRHYKIGKTKAVGRRERDLAILLPKDDLRIIHKIETDDPAGIETYWHARFASKRGNGEWFALDATDVAAFRRRKRFM